jgi:hypothetical protein
VSLRGQAHEKHLNWRRIRPPSPAGARRPSRIEQVLNNLWQCDQVHRKREVTLEGARRDARESGWLRFRVRDTGIGIS